MFNLFINNSLEILNSLIIHLFRLEHIYENADKHFVVPTSPLWSLKEHAISFSLL